MKIHFLLLSLIILFNPQVTWADGFIIVRPHPEWLGASLTPLEVKEHLVSVAIDGQDAVTTVNETFYNPSDRNLEGDYLFPLPPGAQIGKFEMEIGGKMQEAEMLDAEKARGIYEEIVRKAKDPALMEYAGRGLVRVRIFPIEARKDKKVRIVYREILKRDGLLTTYRYPLNTERFSAAPIALVRVDVSLNSAEPLSAIYSPSHTIKTERPTPTQATVSWETKNERPATDFQLVFCQAKEAVGVDLLTQKKAEGDGYFLMLASPTVPEKNETRAPKDVVFVLDTSGSMAGEKLAQAKKALRFCVENLNQEDRFEIIRFSTDAEAYFGKLTTATPDHRKAAGEFLDELKPRGGTAISEALQQALALNPQAADRPYVVIFLTDGLPTVGETTPGKIQEQVSGKRGSARIFSFGLGNDVNTLLLDQIAEASRGFSQYVAEKEDLELKLSNFFGRIQEPVLTDLRIDAGDVKLVELAPPQLPDLFRGDQLVIAGRYHGTGQTTLTLTGKLRGVEKSFTFPVEFRSEKGGPDYIAQLWATRRVGFLLDEIKRNDGKGDNKELIAEVTSLARDYGIVTPYTAWLILEDETRRNVPVAQQTLREIGRDKEARGAAEREWNISNTASLATGTAGVARANAQNAMKFSTAPASSQTLAGAYADSAFSSGIENKSEALRKVTDATQNNRFINGRAFVRNGSQWIDTQAQSQKNAARRIAFASDEYFALSQKNPETAPWLALGKNVLFVLNDELIEIYE